MQIEISGISVEVTKKNIKNINLRVRSDASVHLSVPKHYSYESISQFLYSKLEWIKKHRDKLQSEGTFLPDRPVSGSRFYLFGQVYELEIVYGRRYSLVIDGDRAIFTVTKSSSNKNRQKFINEWYRQKLYEKVKYYLPKWELLTGLQSSSWQIKNMRTRWGTCNTRTKKIWLNLQLAKRPVDCLCYVILHELAHLRVYDHGPQFVSILDRHMPNWRDIKRELDLMS